jgi:hypothetical protein
MELREIKNKEYKLKDVTTILKEKGFVMISEQPITQSGIIKAYQFWFNGKLDTTIGLEIWKNDTTIILKQITLNEI